jgi:hypothetical protein
MSSSWWGWEKPCCRLESWTLYVTWSGAWPQRASFDWIVLSLDGLQARTRCQSQTTSFFYLAWCAKPGWSLFQAFFLMSSKWWTGYPRRSHWSHPSDLQCRDQSDDVLLDVAPVSLAVLASSCDLEKFYTLIDHVLQCDGSHTIFLRQQVIITVFSPFDQRVAIGGFCDCHDPHDPLCWPPNLSAASSLGDPCYEIQGAELRP